MNTHHHDHALVLGGGIAGLLAARVLSESFAAVTVVDRDAIPEEPAPRRGVGQARHIHALLARGQHVLEELFPGLTAALSAGGAPTGDMLGDTRMHLNGHRLCPGPSGLLIISASRALLEHHIRRRVAALDGVTFAPPADVTGLVAAGRRVTGARLLRRADGSAEETVPADLVVDATGRGSRAPHWLAALGFARPPEERIRVDLGYATRHYRWRPGHLGGDLASLHGPTPEHPRGGALGRIEDGRWMLTLAGMVGDHPPTDPDGFLAFARSLRYEDIARTISDAEPLDDPVAYRFTASVRRRYERLDPAPEGFVPLGDSVASFNPVYGQGMTVAALQALALGAHLARRGRPRPRRLLRAITGATAVAWDMAAGADLAFAQVEGRRRVQHRLADRYIRRLHAAAAHDADVARAFVRVSGLVDAPTALLRPGVVATVLRPRRVAGAADHTTGRRDGAITAGNSAAGRGGRT
jgi:2-polyprenyl-6-methoxyphenol hydroxylase-like FAD-dependent oxidoreductase